MFIFIYIHANVNTRTYVSTLGAYARRPTRGRALFPRSRMRKTIFGIQAASCTRREMLERRNYTLVRTCGRA